MKTVAPEPRDIDAADPTTQARIAARLREALVQGRFVPGQALKIRDLAEAFGTSTQPVRAAIKQLVAEQALQALPNRSARVPLLDRTKLEDLTRVRIAVEGLAVELAAQHATKADVRTVRDMLDWRAADDAEHLARHRDFHFTVYRLAQSPTLMPIIESLWLQLGPYLRQATTLVQGQAMEHRHHHALIAALEAHDPAAARAAIVDDIHGSAMLFPGASPAGEPLRWLAAAS